jgi:hypothetical protein
MSHLLLKINLLSYWHVGSSAPASMDVDAEPAVTAEGLPVVPGRTLRGLLRDAAAFACSLEPSLGTDEDLIRWFGSRSQESENTDGDLARSQSARDVQAENRAEADNARARWTTTAGCLEVTNAELGRTPAEQTAFRKWARKKPAERAQLFHRIAQTSIDCDTGMGKGKSLRATRVCLPMPLYAEVSLTTPDRADSERLERLVKAALPYLIQLGRHRTRGLGRVQVTAETFAVKRGGKATHEPVASGKALVELVLVDDIVVSASAATAGGHRSLDTIPGGLLLGAVAKRLYGQQGIDSWRLFHSGAVQFGDALPLQDDGVVLEPIALSLHRQKNTKNEVKDFALQDRESATQWTQLRDGFGPMPKTASAEMTVHRVEKRFGLRTAMDNGVAANGQLFGYESLVGGQRFVATVSAQHDADLTAVLAAFDDQTLRLGRSRATEYGRVHCRILAHPLSQRQHLMGRSCLTLRAQSDLCLRDGDGQPTLQPSAEQLGLPASWKRDDKKTFVRTRTYRPFHGTRQRPGMERQVLRAGSVFAFVANGSPPLDDDAAKRVAEALDRGVGLFRAEGLGRVTVHDGSGPVRLADASLHADSIDYASTLTGHETYELAKARAAASESSDAREAGVEALFQVERLRKRLLKLHKSQWGALRQFATTAEDKNANRILTAFLGDAKERKKEWSELPGTNEALDELQKQLADKDREFLIRWAMKMSQARAERDQGGKA